MTKGRSGIYLCLVSSALITILVISAQQISAEQNYCKDQNSWTEWDELIKKYPDDLDIQTLHALRLGLCAKIERGDIALDQASMIFDRAKEIIIEKKEAELPHDPKTGL